MSAHPRSRGENTASFFGSADTLGSSPLTRGKLLLDEDLGEGARLIPAHAGKTRFRGLRPWRDTAHPRSRGENAARSRDPLRPPGSSPLTRGKRRTTYLHENVGRLIPAHAGKTLGGLGEAAQGGAHPRSRGENHGASHAFHVM